MRSPRCGGRGKEGAEEKKKGSRLKGPNFHNKDCREDGVNGLDSGKKTPHKGIRKEGLIRNLAFRKPVKTSCRENRQRDTL